MSKSATFEQVKDFISDCEQRRDNWLITADRSWAEIKKRDNKNRLKGGRDLNAALKRMRYPLWWTCHQIRKPIVLSRLPVPTLKDTQGDDPYGRTACIIGERLIKGILKTFDALPVFSSAVDDFLITNFGWCRAFYKCEEHEEEEMIRLQEVQQPAPPPQMGPDGQPIPQQPLPPIYVTPDGRQVPNPEFDDIGAYILTGAMVTKKDEQVYLDHGLYSDLLVDPDARRWSQVKKLAYRYEYRYQDFKAKFGEAALKKLVQTDIEEHKTGRPIVVYEYWDYFTREVKWLAENSDDFFQPSAYPTRETNAAALSKVEPKPDDEEEIADEDRAESSDIYNLREFYPNVEPLVMNAPTDEFWPVPEYFQVRDMLIDVDNVVNRMFLLTKAIRVRFLFDGSVPALNALISETGEGGGLAVPNLAQALLNGQGSLSSLVAYFPVEELIQGLQNMYQAFQQRLEMYFQATGLNELIRGATSDVEKTYGERQLEGKYALSRIQPYQWQTQEWMKNTMQLLMEMALQNFSDESLDEYITPQTLDPEDKQRYTGGLRILKSNKRKRFRVDFGTDTTIRINEEYQKKEAVELANAVTKAGESIAKTAETMPELAAANVAVLKRVIEQYSDGKFIIDEITAGLDSVIEGAKQPKPPEFDAAQAKAQFDMQKLTADDRFRQLELQTTTQIEIAKLQQKNRQDAFTQQLEQIKLAISQNKDQSTIELMITKMQSDIALAQEELGLKREQMLVTAQAEGGKQSLEAFRAQIDARVASQEMTLAEAQQQLEAYRVQIEAQDARASLDERILTERRLQDEHAMNKEAHIADTIVKVAEATTPEPPKAPPVTIDLSKTVHIKPGDKKVPSEKKKKPGKK